MLPEVRANRGEQNGTPREAAACWHQSHGEKPTLAPGSRGSKAKGKRPRDSTSLQSCVWPSDGTQASENRGQGNPEVQPPNTAERAQGTSDGPLGSPPYHGRTAGPCPGTAPGEASGDEKQTRASDPSTASSPSPVSTLLASCLQSPHTSRELGSEPRRQHSPPPEAGEGVLVPPNLGRRFWLSHLGEGCSW